MNIRKLRTIIYKMLWIFPINKKKIVFKSYGGLNCGDNPGAIFKEMKSRKMVYKYIWVMQDNLKIDGAKVIKNNSISELYHMATAGYWVDNMRKGEWLRKRRGQKYIQTWHGGLCLKKVEKDAENALPESYLSKAKNDSNMADYFISDSKWTSDLLKRAFYLKDNAIIIEKGLPRDEVFFCDNGLTIKKIYKYYNLDESTNLLLYAPTFRKDGRIDVYNVDFEKILDVLEKRGGKWVAIIRLHPNIATKQSIISYNNRILNGTAYPDLNELIIASSIFITDYSSGMFSAMIAKKEIHIYAPDFDDYKSDRDVYFDLKDLPFGISMTNEELITSIDNFDLDEYSKKRAKFYENVGFFDIDHPAVKTVNSIFGE